MELKKLTDRIFYYPHQTETDRPMLAYIKGAKYNLAIDAGNSDNHVNEFYKALEHNNLNNPDFTIITHWHWDHTFGLHAISGLSIAHEKTNEYLKNEKSKLCDTAYLNSAKQDDKCLAKEYENHKQIIVTPTDIEYQTELTIYLGDISAKIFHSISPHSEDTTLIYIPEERVLFLGDSTSEDFFNHGYMDKNKLRDLMSIIEKTECSYCALSHTDILRKEHLLHYLHSLM